MLHNKIKNAAELRGLEPDEILRELHQDAERQLAREYDERQASKYGLKPNNDEGETFPQEIRLIARALAYRNATLDDFLQLEILLNKAYKAEIDGPEAFRGDSVPVESERISFYLSDNSYQWLIIEAPAGQTTEPEGTILGACCYSTDGHYKLKGVIILSFLISCSPSHILLTKICGLNYVRSKSHEIGIDSFLCCLAALSWPLYRPALTSESSRCFSQEWLSIVTC